MAFKFTDDNVDEVIASGKPVVIDFWGTYCGPCMAMSPIVDELAEEYADKVVIGKYNVEEENDFAAANRIMSIPAFLFYKDGKKVAIRLAGSQSKETLKSKIDELLAM